MGVLNGRLLHDSERPKGTMLKLYPRSTTALMLAGKRHVCMRADRRVSSTVHGRGDALQDTHDASFPAGSTLPRTFGVARYENDTKAALLYDSRRHTGKA